jgi:hypothetical protein
MLFIVSFRFSANVRGPLMGFIHLFRCWRNLKSDPSAPFLKWPNHYFRRCSRRTSTPPHP